MSMYLTPFGLSHLTSHFQRTMNALLSDFSTFTMVYVDDILVYSSGVEQHMTHLDAVIQRLTEFKLTLNLEKSKLGFTKLRLLGHVLTTLYLPVQSNCER